MGSGPIRGEESRYGVVYTGEHDQGRGDGPSHRQRGCGEERKRLERRGSGEVVCLGERGTEE